MHTFLSRVVKEMLDAIVTQNNKSYRWWVIKKEADANLRCAWWGQYCVLVDCEASQSPINKHGLVIPNFLSSLYNSFKTPLSLLFHPTHFCGVYICIFHKLVSFFFFLLLLIYWKITAKRFWHFLLEHNLPTCIYALSVRPIIKKPNNPPDLRDVNSRK